jgi:hypothetical protein
MTDTGRRAGLLPAPRNPQSVAHRWRAPAAIRTVSASKRVLAEMQMSIHLGLRTLALLAVVAAATVILVHPGAGADPALNALLLLVRN